MRKLLLLVVVFIVVMGWSSSTKARLSYGDGEAIGMLGGALITGCTHLIATQMNKPTVVVQVQEGAVPNDVVVLEPGSVGPTIGPNPYWMDGVNYWYYGGGWFLYNNGGYYFHHYAPHSERGWLHQNWGRGYHHHHRNFRR